MRGRNRERQGRRKYGGKEGGREGVEEEDGKMQGWEGGRGKDIEYRLAWIMDI